jgi:hypothetical protein
MTKINGNLLLQFHQHGLSINQGIAVDARLVKSASRPVSNEQLKNDSNHLPMVVISSIHTTDKVQTVYADKRVCRISQSWIPGLEQNQRRHHA